MRIDFLLFIKSGRSGGGGSRRRARSRSPRRSRHRC